MISRFHAPLRAALVLAGLALSGCSHFAGLSCPRAMSAGATAELFFGRNVGAVEGVSDSDWIKFVDEEVTPRFPAGLSVFEAQGQWRGQNGEIVRERSKALLLVLTGEAGETDKIEAIRGAYIARFKQEAVMLVRRQACVGF